ncbi:myosin light chain kinase family member 4 isoform X2 [Sorex araneus]|uniref:myosin light chain kinase family member 4 isoform X2 n=1 Tax=Sorex araneus TaxID=42254 RepID=UPI002433E700|nr:myosin light chain kinase family member 4 isoform X2 [Sorex araneus]
MEATLRRKDLWVVGGVCLLSSSILWLLLRSAARAGLAQAKEKVWSHPSLKESTFVRGKRTSAFPERPAQKTQPSSAQEKVNRLNKKNAEKTKVSLIPGSLGAASPRERGDVVGAPRDATKPREKLDGRDSSGPERLGGQDGDARKTSGGVRENLVFQGQRNGLPSAEETRGGETEKNGAAAAASERELGESWKGKRPGRQTDGDHGCERCLSGVKAVSAPRAPGSPAGGPRFQQTEPAEPAGLSKRRVAEEGASQEDSKKSKTDAASPGARDPCPAHEGLRDQPPGPADKPSAPRDLGTPRDDTLAPPAPFHHRMVTAKKAAISSFYTVDRSEILGGGRFGQVHRCEEKATGLKLAAKIIKTRTAKEKDEVKNEINIMNQLDHVNLIQLYDAFESKNDCILVMEYVAGGELFDRIIDDSYRLTELDVIQFTRQICEGVRHMHQMYILHLDLKPENILCVNRDAKQIKIIDFGLARRYKPREKLKVNFGTPEFLAPEIVNYDFVSFPTDMWSVGVITYMLLSGLSPFLGDNDTETLNNILACRWDLEEEEFQGLSDEGREFVTKLLTKEKNWRISASEALKHPWLADPRLHRRLSAQKQQRPSGARDPTDK